MRKKGLDRFKGANPHYFSRELSLLMVLKEEQ